VLQLVSGCGDSAVNATTAGQPGVRSGDDCLDVLMGDVTAHDRDLHAGSFLISSSAHFLLRLLRQRKSF